MNNKDYSGKEILMDTEVYLSNYNKWTISLLTEGYENTPESKVLDFGSGTGILSKIFSTRFHKLPMAVEIDENLRKISKKKGLKVFSSIEEISDSFDLIFSSNVLEHIDDDRSAIESLLVKLKSGGLISLYLPAFDMLWTSMDDSVGHYRRYNKKILLNLIDGLAVEVIHIRYIDPIGFFVTLLYKFIGNKNGSADKKYLKFYDRYLVRFSRLMNILTGRFFGKNILLIVRKL